MTTKSEKSDGIPRNRGGRLARRARSFKEDLLEKIIQMRSPSSTRAASPHKPLSKLKTDQPAVVERRNSVGEDGSSTKNIPGDELQTYRKDIFSALRYFRDVIDKKTLMQLPGSASAILDTVSEIYMAYKGRLTNEQSSLLLSSNNQVYQSLANLVRWADMVMLHGEAVFEKETVSETLKNFESAIKGLLLLLQEKIKEKTACTSGFDSSSSQLSNGLMGHKKANMCGTKSQEENSSVDHSLPSRQQNTFQTTPFPSLVTLGHSVSSDSILSSTQHTLDDIDLPPPKPPLPSGREMLRPNGRLLSTSSVPDMLPPALPPKKRSQGNWCSPRSHLSHDGYYCQHTSTVCRPSRSSGEWESNRVVSGSDWSSSVGRSPASVSSLSASASSLDSTPNLSSDELLQTAPGDFRYDFDSAWRASSSTMFYQCQTNHAMVRTQRRVQDVSCVEPCNPKITCLTSGTLCSHQNVMTNFIASSSTVTVCTLTSTDCTVKECVTSTHDTPPAIPPKQRSTAQRTPSQYDNVPDFSSDERDSTLPLLYAGSPLSQHRLTTTSSVFDCNSSSSSSGIADCEPLPPPLPPKKKHVTAYMQVFGSCTESNSASYIRSLHGYGCGYIHQEVSSTLSFTKKAATFSLTSSSDDSVFSDTLSAFEPLHCQDSIGNSSPPALPPKKGKGVGMTQGDFLTAVSRLPNDSEDSGYVVGENDLYTTNIFEPVETTNEDSTPDVSHVLPAAPTSNVNVESDSLDPPCSKDVQVLDELDARPFLVYKKEGEDGPDIRGGTVYALVVHATLASRNEIAYQDAFMVTYRTFITPLELVNTLLYRYNKFSQTSEVVRQRTARSAFSLLVRVVGDFRVMDIDNDILQVLAGFVFQLLSSGELSLARALRKKFVEKWNDKILSKQTSLAPLSSKGVSTKQATLLDFKSELLAEQMTLLDADLFQEIEIADVLIWSRLQKEELSPNLTTFTEHFNKMSYWVRSRILEQDDAKDRERYVVKFIKIMKHLRKMNNFNSYLAILSALDSAPIRRLEWQKHITEGLKEYCELIDSTSSFRSYRQALAETEPPCIPYIGLILQDLTFVHIGNNDFITDNVVNFSKRWQQFNILDMMRRFRKCQYNFKSCERIIAFFNNFDDHLCEEAMWQISESIKPRGTKKKVDQGVQ